MKNDQKLRGKRLKKLKTHIVAPRIRGPCSQDTQAGTAFFKLFASSNLCQKILKLWIHHHSGIICLQQLCLRDNRHNVLTMMWRFIFHKRNLEVGSPGWGCWFCGFPSSGFFTVFLCLHQQYIAPNQKDTSKLLELQPLCPHSRQEVARKQKDKWQTNSNKKKTWACLMILALMIEFSSVLTTTKTVSQPGKFGSLLLIMEPAISGPEVKSAEVSEGEGFGWWSLSLFAPTLSPFQVPLCSVTLKQGNPCGRHQSRSLCGLFFVPESWCRTL